MLLSQNTALNTLCALQNKQLKHHLLFVPVPNAGTLINIYFCNQFQVLPP